MWRINQSELNTLCDTAESTSCSIRYIHLWSLVQVQFFLVLSMLTETIPRFSCKNRNTTGPPPLEKITRNLLTLRSKFVGGWLINSIYISVQTSDNSESKSPFPLWAICFLERPLWEMATQHNSGRKLVPQSKGSRSLKALQTMERASYRWTLKNHGALARKGSIYLGDCPSK